MSNETVFKGKGFLNDKTFLDKLDRLKIKDQFIRLTVLSWSEEPICEIQGKTLSGSLNLDGTSSMRRTGNLSLYADNRFNDLANLNNDIGINRKVRVELGIVNTVPPAENGYIDNHGEYQPNNINYQDKYGEIVWFPLGIYVMSNPNISYSLDGVTISISLQDKMCLLNGTAGGVIPAAVTFSEMETVKDGTEEIVIEHPTIYQIIEELVNHFGNEKLANILITDLSETAKRVVKYIGANNLYYYYKNDEHHYTTDYNQAIREAGGIQNVTIFESGMDIGFQETDFTYPGELTCNPGDTVTSVLDNIIKVLGNYEYFYDVNGIFHFQEIKNYLNTSKATELLKELNNSPDYSVTLSEGKSVYTFKGVELITSINNTPNWEEIKNDFVIWGKRTGIDGTEYPIRYHLAIDEKPKTIGYNKAKPGNRTYDSNKPYFGIHEHIVLERDEFDNWIAKQSKQGGETIYTRDYREELYYQGIEAENTGTDVGYYYTELSTEFPKMYNLKEQTFKEDKINDPSSLDFYLDIIDSGVDIGKYSVNTIGRRSRVIEENEINCIFESEIPDIVLVNINNPDEIKRLQKQGQAYYQIDDAFEALLASGGIYNSAYYRMSDLLYENTNLNSTISISSIPLYYLEPNTRITINVDKAGVAGDYVIQSISLPLDISSTMEISAYKAIERL